MVDKKSLSLQEEELLAEEVRVYPCLYDKKDKTFKERDVNRNAWREIAEKLDFIESSEKAQKFFQILKKRYLKKRSELKQSKKSGTSAEAVAKAEKNFQPYLFLSWLDNFIQIREGRTNVTAAFEDELQESEFDIESSLPNSLNESDTESVAESVQLLPEKKKRKIDKNFNSELQSAELAVMKSLQLSLAAKRKNESSEDTSEDLFCKQLAADLKMLPPMERCLAQQELQQTIFKHKYAFLQKKQSNNSISSPKFLSPPLIERRNISNLPVNRSSWLSQLADQAINDEDLSMENNSSF